MAKGFASGGAAGIFTIKACGKRHSRCKECAPDQPWNGWPRGQRSPHYGYRASHTAPSEPASARDFQWAAGFYEGDGSCGSTAGGCLATIGQKQRWSVDRMAAFFGGNTKPIGAYFRWSATGARARGFLMSIYGLLSPRRQEQIRRAMRLGEFACTSG